MRSDIFHPDFKAQPWWWEAWTPNNALSQDPPARTDIVIVGAGYGGLSTALELRRNGVGAVVLERGDFGVGASTRNGGMISGGTNLGKGLGGKSPIAEEFERNKAELMGAGADSLTVLEDIIAREGIECGLHKNGRFIGAWTPKHYADLATKVETYNKYANAGSEMVPRERQREMIASDYYYGGMYARRQAADLWRPRPLHRGAARGQRTGALPLHDRPLPAARRHPHHPCVDRQCRLRARLHAAHGHRPGRALSAGVQRQWRRHDDLSRHPDRQEDRRWTQRAHQPAGRPRLPRARPVQR